MTFFAIAAALVVALLLASSLSGEYWSGKKGGVTINGVRQPGLNWRYRKHTDRIEFTNFESPTAANGEKWEEYDGGFTGAEFSLDMIGDTAKARPPGGTALPFVGEIGGGHQIAGTFVLEDEEEGQEIKGKYTRRWVGRVTGPPTIT